MMLTILIGFASGIISGMGIGGGTLLIPALVFIVGTRQQIAQSINLIVFIPSAIAALCVHVRKKNIEKHLILGLAAAGCVGAVLGSLLAVNLDSGILKKVFGAFLFVMGVYEIKARKEGCK
jgi:uncharacterized membrane protein YfcA